MSSSQQMVRVPRQWLSSYLENDAAMVYVEGERTSLWELLSNAVNSTQPDDQLEVEPTDSPICFQHEEALLKLESEIERKEQVIVDLRLQLSKRCDPCMWSDQQVLDFLGVALRNVDLVGEVRLGEIRQGFEFMKGIEAPVERDERADFERFCIESFNRSCKPFIPINMELMLAARRGEKYSATGWSDMWKGWKARAARDQVGDTVLSPNGEDPVND